ncbi:MAG TPA: cation:proton antiporter subunit C [Caulobacterales bacterium]|jgi:multicomponent Na+:H+ antiporter subunit C|nr:cation:proton antiporter subunit C [Caulobacterales bacterium]
MDPLTIFGRAPYIGVFALAALGLYVLVASRNLVKRVAGLVILQAALALFFAVLGARLGAQAPVIAPGESVYGQAYANPLPQAQMIGALIVGAGVIALALALIVRVREAYGAIEEDEIDAADDQQDRAEGAAAERGG